MKTIAYLRVSKDTQDVKNQKLAILEFAIKESIKINDFMEITASSRKSTKERRINLLLEQLSLGDTIIVSEISRILGTGEPRNQYGRQYTNDDNHDKELDQGKTLVRAQAGHSQTPLKVEK